VLDSAPEFQFSFFLSFQLPAGIGHFLTIPNVTILGSNIVDMSGSCILRIIVVPSFTSGPQNDPFLSLSLLMCFDPEPSNAEYLSISVPIIILVGLRNKVYPQCSDIQVFLYKNISHFSTSHCSSSTKLKFTHYSKTPNHI